MISKLSEKASTSAIPTSYFNALSNTSSTDTYTPKLISLIGNSSNPKQIDYNYDKLILTLNSKANVSDIPTSSIANSLATVSNKP